MLSEDVKAWHSKLCDMSTEDIVSLMETEEIQGVPGDNKRCAISQLIKNKTGEQVVTGFGAILAVTLEGHADFSQDLLYNSDSLRDFVSGFDKNLYPKLVK